MMGLDKTELLNNTHFRVLFIKGIKKSVSREELKQVIEKFGVVETFTLKTRIEDGKVISRGIAIVQYADKESANLALQKLAFEKSIGDMLDIDFYQSKESRMAQLDKVNNPMAIVQQQLSSTMSSSTPVHIQIANNSNFHSAKM